MFSSREYLIIYNDVFNEEVTKNPFNISTFKFAIRNMIEGYKPTSGMWINDISRSVNYNDAVHRIAYLHKYAPIHSCMVQDMLCRALREGDAILKNSITNVDTLKICSLGGGPGIDVLGVMSALHKEFGLRRYSVYVIDAMLGWKTIFDSVLEKLGAKQDPFSINFSPNYFHYSFIEANLLENMSNEVKMAIESADLVTMIKFVSGTTCKDTEPMVRKIFNLINHGAFLLFIDNAAGNFNQLASRLANECGLLPVFGPLEQETYADDVFAIERWGFKGCYNIRVTVHLYMRPNLLTSKPNDQLQIENQSKYFTAPFTQQSLQNDLNKAHSKIHRQLIPTLTNDIEDSDDIYEDYDDSDEDYDDSDEDYDSDTKTFPPIDKDFIRENYNHDEKDFCCDEEDHEFWVGSKYDVDIYISN